MTNDLTPRLADMPTEVLESAAKAMAEDYGDRWDDTDRDSWRSQTRAAYPIIARWVAAQALRTAADLIDLRKARLAGLLDSTPSDYDTWGDYSEDLAKAWLHCYADEAEVADHE